MIAITPPVDQTAEDLQIVIIVEEPTSGARLIQTDFTYDYLPNPTVIDMQPHSHLLGYDVVSV